MRCRRTGSAEPPLHPGRRPLADSRVGLARLVRVRQRPRPVHSRLQPHPRRRQRIVVSLTEALVEHRRHRLVEGEIRRGLARRYRTHAHEPGAHAPAVTTTAFARTPSSGTVSPSSSIDSTEFARAGPARGGC